MAKHATQKNPFIPVNFTSVKLQDPFWEPRIRSNHEHTIPHILAKLQETGRLEALKLNWKPGIEPVPHIFWDSDVAKWLEAACYDLQLHPAHEPAIIIDDVSAGIQEAQQPDGYLNTYFTSVAPEKRWVNLRDWHELYCAGHLIEAALAHWQATGKRNLLEAIERYVELIASKFGHEKGKRRGYPGHPEIELALLKLHRITGNPEHLRLSSYFVEERGREPNYFVKEAQSRGERGGPPMGLDYYQAHCTVRTETNAVGHAVRATYLYTAMAELAMELSDAELFKTCDKLFESIRLKRMYLTGGIGSEAQGERFTRDFDLPNETAYAETCAAIGLVFFAHRMLQIGCDSRFSDVIERALYNAIASGVSLDGKSFFYDNPLASHGQHRRQDWFECACCPPNIARLLPTIGGYYYSVNGDTIAVHLYGQSKARVSLPADRVVLINQETNYPWDGAVQLRIDGEGEFEVRLRIPEWCRNWHLALNGKSMEARLELGYACLSRNWVPGDTITLDMKMPVARIISHPEVVQNFGRIALSRGPLVYCLEGLDHSCSVHALRLRRDKAISPTFVKNLLGGIVTLDGEADFMDEAAWQGILYRPTETAPSLLGGTRLRAIPYAVWANRGASDMVTWIPSAEDQGS